MKIYLNAANNWEQWGLRSWNKRDYLLAAAKRMGWDFIKDISECEDDPEYVLNIEPCGDSPIVGTKWTGYWHIDIVLGTNRPELFYPYVDTVFISSNQHSNPEMMDRHNAQVLFQATDPQLHKRIKGIDQDFDIAFAGSMDNAVYAERSSMYQKLREDYKVNEYGKNHTPQQYIEYMNTGKVMWIRTGVGPDGHQAAAQRFFELLGIGPVLTNHTDDLRLLGLVEGKDYMSYRNETECRQKLDKLLADEDLRNTIAANGRNAALRLHTYEHRIMSIYQVAYEHTHRTT